METIKSALEFFQKLGIQDEFVILTLVGIAVAYAVQKNNRIFRSYHINLMRFLERFEQKMDWIRADHDKNELKIEQQEEGLHAQITQNEVQKESMKEKLDGLHDDLKEIKKQLLFRN